MSPTALRFRVGDLVEVLTPPPHRRHVRPGTRGRITEDLGYWTLLAVQFPDERTPTVLRAAHLRSLASDEEEQGS